MTELYPPPPAAMQVGVPLPWWRWLVMAADLALLLLLLHVFGA